MGAVPKHKSSSYRQGKRRSSKKLTPVNYTRCTSCQKPRLPHQACPHCGSYRSA